MIDFLTFIKMQGNKDFALYPYQKQILRSVTMKVQNMTSAKGNKIANQFIITGAQEVNTIAGKKLVNVEYFQSYEAIIAKKIDGMIFLDKKYWDYSVVTGKYRNMFLGETKKETQAKIDSGEYALADLN